MILNWIVEKSTLYFDIGHSESGSKCKIYVLRLLYKSLKVIGRKLDTKDEFINFDTVHLNSFQNARGLAIILLSVHIYSQCFF